MATRKDRKLNQLFPIDSWVIDSRFPKNGQAKVVSINKVTLMIRWPDGAICGLSLDQAFERLTKY
jgi:hypothetical protein